MNIESVNKYNARFYHFKYYKKTYSVPKLRTHTHTHTRLTALFPGLPRCSS